MTLTSRWTWSLHPAQHVEGEQRSAASKKLRPRCTPVVVRVSPWSNLREERSPHRGYYRVSDPVGNQHSCQSSQYDLGVSTQLQAKRRALGTPRPAAIMPPSSSTSRLVSRALPRPARPAGRRWTPYPWPCRQAVVGRGPCLATEEVAAMDGKSEKISPHPKKLSPVNSDEPHRMTDRT